jgi:hypothetical protein
MFGSRPLEITYRAPVNKKLKSGFGGVTMIVSVWDDDWLVAVIFTR